MKTVRLTLALVLSAAAVSANSLVLSIHSVAAKDYKRERLPNGAYKRERYAIANGGWLDGSTRDNKLDEIPFADVAGILAEHLGRQNYFLAKDSKSADLLLVVHWGRTIAFDSISNTSAMNAASHAFREALSDQGGPGAIAASGEPTTPALEQFESAMVTLQMFNKARDLVNERNALMLGYLSDINRRNGVQRWTGGGDAYDDLIRDIEESRYYITVTAYDFDDMVKRQKRTVRWVTRVSIRAPGNSFRTEFPVMLASASRYFGRDTGKLIRGDQAVVEIGDVEVVGISAEREKK